MKLLTSPTDKRYIFIQPEQPGEITKLIKYINKIPQYQLLPSYRGIPTPEAFIDHFTSSKTGKIIYYTSMGLWREIQQYMISQGYNCNELDDVDKYTDFNLSKDDLKSYIKTLDLSLQPRESQISAAWKILHYKRSLSELCTRFGKTLVLYIVSRYALEKMGVKKILMIVPSVYLVKQGTEDFKQYGDIFKVESIWAGGKKDPSTNITIGTFQSLVLKTDRRNKHYDPQFFQQFDMVCCDECHRLPCKSIKKILAALPSDIKLQFGFTGTLPKPGTIENFCCQSLMGPKIQEIKAEELVEQGFLAEPIITQYRIKYSDYQNVLLKCAEYLVSNYVLENGKKILLLAGQREFTMIHQKQLPIAIQQIKSQYDTQAYINYLLSLIKANSQTLLLEQMISQYSAIKLDIIEKLVNSTSSNIIIFAHNTEYIQFLFKYLSKKLPFKTIHKLTGSTTIKKREEYIKNLINSQNNILIGSFGVVGTGLTIKNIDVGIFAQSFKSDIINKQSLGRLMLRDKDKTQFYLYDLIDVFDTKKIYLQGTAKLKTFKEEGWNYTIINKEAKFQSVKLYK